MDRKVFDPKEWINAEWGGMNGGEGEMKKSTLEGMKKGTLEGGTDAGTSGETNDGVRPVEIAEVRREVESVIKAIEGRKVDITGRYAEWRNIGFALASTFGEEGRELYHRVSAFYAKYHRGECDQQYTNCLKGKRNGITIKSFFYYAKEAGVDIQAGVDIYNVKGTIERQDVKQEQQTEQEQNTIQGQFIEQGARIEQEQQVEQRAGQQEEVQQKGARLEREWLPGQKQMIDVETEGLPVPYLPDGIFEDIPEFLKKVVVHAASREERDIMLIGSVVALSACFPNFYGIYDGKKVYPNLFLFITAKASAGKGRLVHCKQLVQPIHMHLREQAKLLKKEYEVLLMEYNRMEDKGEKPGRPAEKMLLIPANNSTTGVFQLLHENEGRGMIFETEGDTLAQAFKSDYGNYSDGFRKAFHHETISYYRRTDREYVDIQSPCVSTILSGTPKQVSTLIPNAENGLFSRFMFYYMNIQPEWKDVFSFSDEESLDVYFGKLGKEIFGLYEQLTQEEEVQFLLTAEQQVRFNQFFKQIQGAYLSLKGIDYLATVRRLGLIAFRLCMIFTALRIMEHGGVQRQMVCEDRDFEVALEMTRTLVRHAAKVFSELPEEEQLPKRSNRKERFYEVLPETFSTKVYKEAAVRLAIPDKTAERYMADFCKNGLVHRDGYGVYFKMVQQKG